MQTFLFGPSARHLLRWQSISLVSNLAQESWWMPRTVLRRLRPVGSIARPSMRLSTLAWERVEWSMAALRNRGVPPRIYDQFESSVFEIILP